MMPETYLVVDAAIAASAAQNTTSYTAFSRSSRDSKKYLDDLNIDAGDLSRIYKTSRVRRHGGIFSSLHAAELWDYFTVRALVWTSVRPNRLNDDSELFYWLHNLNKKLAAENNAQGDSSQGYIQGAVVMSSLSMDFAIWLSRLPDEALSRNGGEMLHSMLERGATEIVAVPGEVNERTGFHSDIQHVAIPLYTDGSSGTYTPRFLGAWGDEEDVRMLDFYRAGIVDAAAIRGYLSNGVNADLAASLSSDGT